MTQPTPRRSASELAGVALSTAREAAALLLPGYRSCPAATEKARSDLVTEYDVRSEERIRKLLGERTPEIAVVGEERGGRASDLTWYADPLDGTMNFVHGHPFFCVSLGIVDERGPLAGAVCAPALGLEWWGGRGLGAFRNGAACRVSEVDSLRRSLLGTGFPLDRSTPPGNNLPTFAHVIQHVQGIRRCGSAAIDCALVADGTYDGYWERALHAWDLAGGAAVALAAGGRLTSLDGGEPDITHGNVVLTNGKIHDELVRLLAAEG